MAEEKKKGGVSEHFKEAIKKHLDGLAEDDPLFAVTYAKENKSLEECCNYILNQVQKSGLQGFDDSEIFGMAVHYYDEDDIKDVKTASQCKIISNHFHELTEEEKAEARKKAMDELIAKERARMSEKPERKKKKEEDKLKPKTITNFEKDEDGNSKIVTKTIEPEKPKFKQQTLF